VLNRTAVLPGAAVLNEQCGNPANLQSVNPSIRNPQCVNRHSTIVNRK
jgi:hypothetical protein